MRVEGDEGWSMTIEIHASDFESLKSQAKLVLRDVSAANSVREFPTSGASVQGQGGSSCSFHVKWASPAEHRVALLRKEADELEATLGDV